MAKLRSANDEPVLARDSSTMFNQQICCCPGRYTSQNHPRANHERKKMDQSESKPINQAYRCKPIL